jgi:hypothetical protein
MPLGLPVNRLVNVDLVIAPQAAQLSNFDTALIMGDSNVIDVSERIRSYSGISDVAVDFSVNSPEYQAALLFFSQTPTPAQLYIGRWAKSATAAVLKGAPLSGAQQAISNFTPATAGVFFVYEDGVPLNVSGLNFSAQTNLNGVASIIQAAMAALEANTTVVWNSNFDRFEITSGTTGATSTLSFLSTSKAIGSLNFGGQPANLDTVTINGTVVTFVNALTTGNQILIGTTLAATIANAVTFLNGSADVNLSLMTYTGTASKVYIVAKATGTTGNAYTLAKTSVNVTVSGATMSGGSNSTDVSALLLGRSTDSGAYVAQGMAAESAVNAVTAMDSLSTQWYALAFAATPSSSTDVLSNADTLAVAAFIEADANNPHLFGVTTGQGAALLTNDTTSIGAQLKALGYRRTFYQYSSSSLYAAVSILGRGCTVNFNESLSTINFMWRQEPGVVAETLNSTQADALDANRYNYFAAFKNSTSIVVNGTTPAGYIDETWDLDWFVNDLQTNVFNTLYTIPKVPQTDQGESLLGNSMNASCIAAVNNGTLAPGVWNGPGFGQLQTGDFMPKGYYVFQPSVASQNQADREARKSVPFQIGVKLAGAVNDVFITVNVNR